MLTNTRKANITFLMVMLLLTSQSMALDGKKTTKRAEFEIGKACSEQCRKQHVDDNKNSQQYNRGVYEDCMNQCVEAKQPIVRKR